MLTVIFKSKNFQLFCMRFMRLFQQIRNHIFGKKFNHTVKALFTNNEGNTDETAEKTKNFFYKCVLELNFCFHQWPGRTKLLKSLHPTVYILAFHLLTVNIQVCICLARPPLILYMYDGEWYVLYPPIPLHITLAHIILCTTLQIKKMYM